MNRLSAIQALIDLFFPVHCALCGEVLKVGEECICLNCLYNLPKSAFQEDQKGWLAQLFWGKAHVMEANAFLMFEKDNDTQQVIHRIKYKGNKELGVYMGRVAAAFLKTKHAYATVDYIIPIPLHKNKLKQRGYNQSMAIARGLSDVLGIPLLDNYLERTVQTSTQTNKNAFERWNNTNNAFSITINPQIQGKHLLLVDDVLTTGATLISAANALSDAHEISIFTLACAHKV